jgi:hypothetical protein
MKFCIDAPILDMPGYPPLLYVDRNSIDAWKENLAMSARLFKKEMNFDHLQFDESMYENDNFVGVLFLQRAMDLVLHEDHYPNRVVGGAVFVAHGASFELDWLWLHPFARNRKMLKSNWPTLTQRFGSFSVAKPISLQMSAFIQKHHQIS